jgi:hypothetical protein
MVLDLGDASRFPRGLIRLDDISYSTKEYTSDEFKEFKSSLKEALAAGAECSPLFVLVDPDEHFELANDPNAAMAGNDICCDLLVFDIQ